MLRWGGLFCYCPTAWRERGNLHVSTNMDAVTHVNVTLAADGMLVLLLFFVGLIGAWWALGSLKWEKIAHQPLGGQAQLLRFFLALIGGILTVLVAVLLLGAIQLLNGSL